MTTSTRVFRSSVLLCLLLIEALWTAYLWVPSPPAHGATPVSTWSEADSTSRAVRPIDWSRFEGEAPVGPDAVRVRQILLNANRYALTTWWHEAKGYAAQSGYMLDFGGTAEREIRPGAEEAFSLTASLATDAYEPQVVGVGRAEAEAVAVKLIRSLAYRHKANTDGGWGDHWQSAWWAAEAGFAGWLMWDRLPQEERELVRNMVQYEADRFLSYQVPYYRDQSGEVIRPGDTAAEENAWNAALLSLATAMMPDHPNWSVWMDKNLELLISAYSRPSDVGSSQVVNGKPLSRWLGGSNTEQNGTVVNHNILHPDYLTSITGNLTAPMVYALAGDPTPRAAFFNADVVYAALVDVSFSSPPHQPPGGTMYVNGSSDIYYPEGSDWGIGRRMIYAELDAQARTHGFDHLASQPAATWEPLHAGAALAQQQRHPDGRMFASDTENNFHAREEFDAAALSARAYLTKWLDHNAEWQVTDRAYPVLPPDDQTADLSITGPEAFMPAQAQEVAVVLANGGDATMTDVDLTLAVPDRWNVEQTSDPVAGRVVLPGQSVRATFAVTAPTDAISGPAEVTATATYSAMGRRRAAQDIWRTCTRFCYADVWDLRNQDPAQVLIGSTMRTRAVLGYTEAVETSDPAWEQSPVPDASGTAPTVLALDGRDDVVTLADTAGLDLSSGFVFEAWTYQRSPTVLPRVISKGPVQLWINTNGSLHVLAQSTTGRIDTESTAGAVPLNTWTHVGLVYDMATSGERVFRIFVNGDEVTYTAQGTYPADARLAGLGNVVLLGNVAERVRGLNGLFAYARLTVPGDETAQQWNTGLFPTSPAGGP